MSTPRSMQRRAKALKKRLSQRNVIISKNQGDLVLFLWGLSVMSCDGFWFLSMEEVCGMVTSHAKSRLLSPKEIEMVINHVKSRHLSPKEIEMVINHVKSQYLSPKEIEMVINHVKSQYLSPKEMEMVISRAESRYLSPKEMEMVISHVKSQHLSPKFLRIVIDLHSNSLNPGAYVLTFNQLM